MHVSVSGFVKYGIVTAVKPPKSSFRWEKITLNFALSQLKLLCVAALCIFITFVDKGTITKNTFDIASAIFSRQKKKKKKHIPFKEQWFYSQKK